MRQPELFVFKSTSARRFKMIFRYFLHLEDRDSPLLKEFEFVANPKNCEFDSLPDKRQDLLVFRIEDMRQIATKDRLHYTFVAEGTIFDEGLSGVELHGVFRGNYIGTSFALAVELD